MADYQELEGIRYKATRTEHLIDFDFPDKGYMIRLELPMAVQKFDLQSFVVPAISQLAEGATAEEFGIQVMYGGSDPTEKLRRIFTTMIWHRRSGQQAYTKFTELDQINEVFGSDDNWMMFVLGLAIQHIMPNEGNSAAAADAKLPSDPKTSKGEPGDGSSETSTKSKTGAGTGGKLTETRPPSPQT